MQLNHYNSKFKKNKFPITLICDSVINAPNIGSLFRLSDALGVEELIFCGNNTTIGKRIKKTSRATEKYVPFKTNAIITEEIDNLKQKNYQIIALEITENSIPLTDFKLQTNSPIALIIGNENFGVSEDILQKTDTVLHINMFGDNSSMNVVQATSITLYELTKQLQNSTNN